jgi:hypothetical protein
MVVGDDGKSKGKDERGTDDTATERGRAEASEVWYEYER